MVQTFRKHVSQLNYTNKLVLLSRILVLITWICTLTYYLLILYQNPTSEITGLPYKIPNILLWNSIPHLILFTLTYRPKVNDVSATIVLCFVTTFLAIEFFRNGYSVVNFLQRTVIGLPDYSKNPIELSYFGTTFVYLVLLIPIIIVYLLIHRFFKKFSEIP